MSKPYRDDFETLAEFLAAVVGAAANGYANADMRLQFSASAAGANETVPSEGGFLVPTQFAEILWQAATDMGAILGRCGRQPITAGDKLSIPAIDETSRADGSRFGGARLFWTEEGDAPTATKPKFRSINIAPKKLLGLAYATNELLSDAVALAAWLERTFGLEASFAIEDAIVNGNGVGKPLGLINSGALISVAAESGQAADTVVAANFAAMMGRLWGPSRRNSIWLASNDVMLQAEPLQLANGKALVEYDANGMPRILGRPVFQTEYSPAIGDAGDVILADLGQYLIGEKAPEFLSSIHVRFLYDEGVFRFRYRVDGQPAWRTPVTPKNSVTTQSPFVALEAR